MYRCGLMGRQEDDKEGRSLGGCAVSDATAVVLSMSQSASGAWDKSCGFALWPPTGSGNSPAPTWGPATVGWLMSAPAPCCAVGAPHQQRLLAFVPALWTTDN